MKTKQINKTADYRLAIMRKSEYDYDEIDKSPYRKTYRWSDWIGFELTDEEVIEVLALISRMRGILK